MGLLVQGALLFIALFLSVGVYQRSPEVRQAVQPLVEHPAVQGAYERGHKLYTDVKPQVEAAVRQAVQHPQVQVLHQQVQGVIISARQAYGEYVPKVQQAAREVLNHPTVQQGISKSRELYTAVEEKAVKPLLQHPFAGQVAEAYGKHVQPQLEALWQAGAGAYQAGRSSRQADAASVVQVAPAFVTSTVTAAQNAGHGVGYELGACKLAGKVSRCRQQWQAWGGRVCVGWEADLCRACPPASSCLW